MKKYFLLSFSVFLICESLAGQKTDINTAKYQQTIYQRTYKIVTKQGIADSIKFYQVSDIIAQQYFDLNLIYFIRDSSVKVLKDQQRTDKAGLAAIRELIDKRLNYQLDSLHPLYLTRLSDFLDDKQIGQVKDGMTFGVLPLTYKAYLEMILTLTETQKKQIMNWLLEAREHAMDAESAEKKHAWFGKYKGRINNYLSKEGFDIKKEEEGWQLRIKEKKSSD